MMRFYEELYQAIDTCQNKNTDIYRTVNLDRVKELIKEKYLDDETRKKTSNELKHAYEDKLNRFSKDFDPSDWNCQPVATERHEGTWSIVKIIHNLVDEGHKRIFIACCNPDHKELPDSVKRIPGVIINCGLYTRYGI